jgi:hypothetical protein
MEAGDAAEWLLHPGCALVEFPRTHDLQELLILIRDSGTSIPPELEEVTALSRFAVETRYPGDFELITPDEVEHAIELVSGEGRCLGAGKDVNFCKPSEHVDPCAIGMATVQPQIGVCKKFSSPQAGKMSNSLESLVRFLAVGLAHAALDSLTVALDEFSEFLGRR